jgi:TPR repeat protein
MTGNNAKPAAKKPEGAEAAKVDSASASDEAAKGSSESTDASTSSASKDQADAKPASDKSAEKDDVADGNSAADSDEAKASSSSDHAETAKPESDSPAPKAAKAPAAKLAAVEKEPAAPKPLGDKDPLIIQAERYLQGRGVRQDCGKGINLLHQAMSAGNPAADVKMGALYWSGTCVTQSNVTAYQWFSRAHSLEPQNRWIERSRNSVWARMSPDEKRRIGY